MEHTDTDSGTSIESRLSAMFGGEAEVPAPETDPTETAQQVETDAPNDGEEVESEEVEAQPDFVEVEDDEGNKHKVPASLERHFLREKDHTQKTQALSALTKTVEAKAAFVETREKMLGAVMQDVLALEQSRSRLTQLQQMDWAALYNADPGQALNLRSQMDTLKGQVDQQQALIGSKVKQVEQAQQQFQTQAWQNAVNGVVAKLGKVNPADDAAMLKQVADLGFEESEVKSKLADPRILLAIYKAAKYDQLQAKKPGAMQTLQKAPPVVKPGAGNNMPAEVKQNLSFRKALKAAPNSQSKAKIIEQRLANMFK